MDPDALNVKENIVERLKALALRHPLGTVVTGYGCSCEFNKRWSQEMVFGMGTDDTQKSLLVASLKFFLLK